MRLFCFHSEHETQTFIYNNATATAWPHHDQNHRIMSREKIQLQHVHFYTYTHVNNDHVEANRSHCRSLHWRPRIFNVLIFRTILAAYRQFGSFGVSYGAHHANTTQNQIGHQLVYIRCAILPINESCEYRTGSV